MGRVPSCAASETETLSHSSLPHRLRCAAGKSRASGFASSKYDQLLNEAENVYGNKPVQRWKRLVAAEKLLMNEQGTIPLIQTAKPQLVQSYVKNVSYNPLGIPYDFKLVYIKK